MKTFLAASAFTLALAASAHAESAFEVHTDGNDANAAINEIHAYCIKPAAKAPPRQTLSYVERGLNTSMGVSWKNSPSGTKSYALLMYDVEAITDALNKDRNQVGKNIPEDAPRQLFYNWVLAHIPADVTELKQGIDGNKNQTLDTLPNPQTQYGLRGQNGMKMSDPKNIEHKGMLLGYHGPCPPFNDMRVHHYYIKVYALDVAKLDLVKDFSGPELEEAVKGHVLATGSTHGHYSINPSYHPEKTPAPVATPPR